MEGNNASAFETQSTGKTGRGQVMNKTKYPTFLLSVWYSWSSSIFNVFGDTSGPGNLQMVKKVVVTKGKFKDYMGEIQQSYELGFTPYRLHKNQYGIYVTSSRVYVLDNVATMDVSDRYLKAVSRKLIYFVKSDGGSSGALQGDRGPSGTRGLQGDSGGQGSVGSSGPA